MRRIITNSNKNPANYPNILKGITPKQVKELIQSQAAKGQGMKYINSRKRVVKKPITPGIKKTPVYKRPSVDRPSAKYLVNLATDVSRIEMPEPGSFNPGLVKMPGSDKYIMVYRPDEYHFVGCILSKSLKPDSKSYFRFRINNCADPRLIWLPDNRLLMVYSSTTKVGLNYECIRGSVIMDLNISDSFIDAEPFRISPEGLTTRQKNWMPFINNGKLYLIGSICPHIIYELNMSTWECQQVFETQWMNPWIFPNEFLRGNTNPVLLDDGNYLGTFHTATWFEDKCHYDNGCYIFEGKAPFRVLKCANKTYLPAEGAIERHYRNARTIVCTFPVGMVKEENNILISYGDNDSIVKIMKTTVEDMSNLLLDVY